MIGAGGKLAFPPIGGWDSARALRDMADALIVNEGTKSLARVKVIVLAAQDLEAMAREIAGLKAQIEAFRARGVPLDIADAVRPEGSA